MAERLCLTCPIDTIDKRSLAAKLCVSCSTLMRWVRAGHFPKPIRLSEQTIVWRLGTVEAWLVERERAAPMAKTLDDICVQITTKWRKELSDILDIGNLLLEARELHPRQFLRWVDAMKAEGKLPIGRRAAEKYLKIAKHPILSDANYSSHLPPCLSTLDKLARLPAEEVKRLIKQGQIHPDLSFDEAVDLVQGRARPEKPSVNQSAGERQLAALEALAHEALADDLGELAETWERSGAGADLHAFIHLNNCLAKRLAEMTRRFERVTGVKETSRAA